MREPNPQIRPLLEAMRDVPAFSDLTPMGARELLAQMAAARPSIALPPIGEVRDFFVPGPGGPLLLRHYRPSPAPRGAVVYLHGGGWVIGSPDTSDALCRTLVHASGCEFYSVNYRLAPEFPYPAALDDTHAALSWVARQTQGPLFIAGDSAGGNLAAAGVLRARGTRGPHLAGQILLYPVLDHDFSTASYETHGPRKLVLSAADMRWYWNHYVPDEARRRDPLASPLRAGDLGMLPPALIVVAGLDPLRDEALAYARRLQSAGTTVEVHGYEDMVHGFLGMIGFVDLAAEAATSAGHWIRDRTISATRETRPG
jgi:acetyl esterase